jgi:hypothetical protein
MAATEFQHSANLIFHKDPVTTLMLRQNVNLALKLALHDLIW